MRLVRQLRKELGTKHGTIQRVAEQIGCGVDELATLSWVHWFNDDRLSPGVSELLRDVA